MNNEGRLLMRNSVVVVIMDFIGVFLGAFLGAYLGYQFNLHQNKQEIQAKQEILFTLLRSEVANISTQVQPYNARKVQYQDPIHLSAPTQLLDGETLDYKNHPDIIRSLLSLQIAIAKYNDLVETLNLVQSIQGIPDSTHRQMYETIVKYHQAVIAARDQLLNYRSNL